MYGWNYSWLQIKELYIQKSKEKSEQLQVLCSFLVDLTQAAFGGGKSDNEITTDSGDGVEDLEPEQLEEMKIMLGDEDFNRLYGHLVDV